MVVKKIMILLCVAMPYIVCEQTIENNFTQIFNTHYWHSPESVSGHGSELIETEVIRKELPSLLISLNADSLLDAACGDFNWMRHVDLPIKLYIGVDVVKDLIAKDNLLYGSTSRQFMHLDISQDALPKTDIILCRDCIVHHPFASGKKIIKNFKQSGAKYLLATTYPSVRNNIDIAKVGFEWRRLNLQLKPFNFPTPLVMIDEKEAKGKFLGLWKLEEIPTE